MFFTGGTPSSNPLCPSTPPLPDARHRLPPILTPSQCIPRKKELRDALDPSPVDHRARLCFKHMNTRADTRHAGSCYG